MKISAKINTLYIALPLLATLVMAGCSGQGPDVVDPASGSRNQLALIAVDNGDGGELVRYNRSRGIESTSEYTDANGLPLGMAVDGIYESAYDRLYLHHRAEGTMTVLDVRTRKKVAEIAGFHASADSGLTGMAFSNLSQGWVIAYGAKKLYHVDAVTLSVVDHQTVDLPGYPTSVATSGTAVYVGMQLDDGTGQVAILRSNAGGIFTIERTLSFATPIIYMIADPEGTNMVMISSGGNPAGASAAIRPRVFGIRLGSYEVDYERDLDIPSLFGAIGKQPTYVGISNEAYLYIATSNKVVRVDTRASGQGDDYYFGPTGVIGVDYWTNTLYVYNRAEGSLVPISSDSQELDHVMIEGDVRAMHFITPSKVR